MLEIQQAKANGWIPSTLTKEKRLNCIAGCGRYLVADNGDKTCGYYCNECKNSITSFKTPRGGKKNAT